MEEYLLHASGIVFVLSLYLCINHARENWGIPSPQKKPTDKAPLKRIK